MVLHTDVRLELDAVELHLKEVLEGVDAPRLKEVASYAISSGGKRTRPLMLVLVGELFGTPVERCLDAAVAVELMHTASLLHDDILDEGIVRRGKEAPSRRFGTESALLCADLLISMCVELLSPYDPEVMRTFSRTGVHMAEGEQLDVLGCSPQSYMECIEKKTASLFSCAARMGALIARAPERYVDACSRMGWHTGIGYQLVDDLLEYAGYHEHKLSLRARAGYPALMLELGDEPVSSTVELIFQHERRAQVHLSTLSEVHPKPQAQLSQLIHSLTTGMVKGMELSGLISTHR